MRSLFRRKKKADLDFTYFSIGEGLDVDSQLAEATTAPPAQFANANYGFSAKSKTTSRGKFTVQANKGKATPHANATNEGNDHDDLPRQRNALHGLLQEALVLHDGVVQLRVGVCEL